MENMTRHPHRREPARTVVVTVNYRTADQVVSSLESMAPAREADGGVEVVVVDNNSDDGSVDLLRDAVERQGWSEWVTVIASDVNGGFSAGNNLGIRQGLQRREGPPDFFLLLNSDAHVLPGAVGALVRFLDSSPSAGVAGSRLRRPNGKIWPYSFAFPTPLGEFDAGIQSRAMSERLAPWRTVLVMSDDVPTEVGWVGGASMMIRREVLEEVGLMDDAYFLYFEETDLSLRAKRAGWTSWYVPDSEVVHAFGKSTGFDPNTKATKALPSYWFDSRRRYFLKNHGRLYTLAADAARIAGVLISRVRRVVKRQDDLHPPHFLRDLARNSVFVRVPLTRPKSDLDC
jgi:GT2 family glycosyltransferase